MSAKNESNSDSKWICKICLGSLKKPVVTQCGHLFCWKCMYRWMETEKSCPVCKGGIPTANPPHLTPIYGHDNDDNDNNNNDNKESGNDNDRKERKEEEDEDIPNRPRGRRQAPPPPRNRRNNNFEIHFFGGFQIFDFIAEAIQANQGQYASYQDQMDDYISKGIIAFLLFTIFTIVTGMI